MNILSLPAESMITARKRLPRRRRSCSIPTWQADAFNPAELLLASLAACILKGTERVMPMLDFNLRGISISLNGVRQDSPPKMLSISYEIVVDTDENDARLALLHRNLQKFGTIYNTLADATSLTGTIRRQE